MDAAKAGDWNAMPLPEKRATIPLNRLYSADEMSLIRGGLIPRQMEDKWFIYWENGALFFHRSWTGICLFVVRFTAEGDGCRAVEVCVNRDSQEYGATDDAHDAELALYLIDALLLRKAIDPPGGEHANPLATWSLVGRAMLGQHPDDAADDPSDLGFTTHPPP